MTTELIGPAPTAAYVSWTIPHVGVATSRVLSVSAHRWRLMDADGVTWLREGGAPTGAWESTPEEVAAWRRRYCRWAREAA